MVDGPLHYHRLSTINHQQRGYDGAGTTTEKNDGQHTGDCSCPDAARPRIPARAHGRAEEDDGADARSLRDKIFDIKVPTETEIRNRAGKRQSVKRKVFPGYVLIQMVLDEETWHLVRSTTGVTGFVSSGNKPVPLQEREVQVILQ